MLHSEVTLMPSICISHKEDVDGLCSAALVKTAFDISKIVLVDYANLISRLEKVAAMLEKIEQLFKKERAQIHGIASQNSFYRRRSDLH
jgi:oligoribonuclease NrnB/cAMP/cGMP phosphodiesterase (DHH superfamily)